MCVKCPAYPPRQRWVPDATAYMQGGAPPMMLDRAHTHLVRGGFLMLQPRRRSADEARSTAYTHLVRGGFLMLQPRRRSADEARSTAHTHLVRGGFLMPQPTGDGARPMRLDQSHTHLVRGGFLMLQPTGDGARPMRLDQSHTHLVRGGFLMLQPTARRRTADDARSSTYPPRQRWVRDVAACPCTDSSPSKYRPVRS